MTLKQDKKMIVCFLTPALFFFIIAFLYPVIRTIVMSFFRVEGISDPLSTWEFVGISNFLKLAQTSIFQNSMLNMFKIWLFGGILVLSISILFAAILTSGVKGKEFYKAVIYIPNIINAVAMSTMWIQSIYNRRFGILNRFFAMIGLEELSKIDYMSGNIKFWTLLIAFCFGSVGYYMLIFMSGIERISGDVYEAATIDGANKMRQFFTITLPLLKGVFKTCLTFWTVGVVGFFVWSRMWSHPLGSELDTITPFVYMYNVTFGTSGNTARDAGMGAAVGVIMAVVVLIVFFAINKLIKNDDIEF